MTTRAGENVASFLLGVLLGVLGTFAAWSGRISSLETSVGHHTQQLEQVESQISKLSDLVVTALRK